MVPSGMSLIGLVEHLGSAEHGWLCDTFGRDSEAVAFTDNGPDADGRIVPGKSAADVVAYYCRARTEADEVIYELDLDDVGTAWHGATVTLPWVLTRWWRSGVSCR
ncbi:DUF664 domain-containing protein [Georgenia muralis]|uniref:mycothiol transferase n=1 Tax=Georgenia muralis TaxID=154117 RepID=UPI0024823FC5|nr:DUF664 domain-containing protein [Georgenia muralis]